MKKTLSMLLSIIAVTIVFCVPALGAEEASPVLPEAEFEAPLMAAAVEPEEEAAIEPAAPIAMEDELMADVPATVAATANGWVKEDGSWYYYKNGTMLQDYWLFGEGSANGLWYYLGKDGKMATGFQYVENPNGTGWFMFQDTNYNGCEGALLSGWQATGVAGTGWFETRHNGHFGECTWTSAWGDYDRSTNTWSNGGPSGSTTPPAPSHPANGWFTDDNGSKYYYKNNKAVTGWQYIEGTYYYFNGTGKMVTGDWAQDGNGWYFLGADGKMLDGLRNIDLGRADDGLYYFNPEHDGTFGKVLTGWQWVDGYWYYFNPKHNGTFGRAFDNGWNSIGGKYYYFYSDGKMAANCDVDGYHVNSDGSRGDKVAGPWLTDEQVAQAEQEIWAYAAETYGLEYKAGGGYADIYYYGLATSENGFAPLYAGTTGVYNGKGLNATTEYGGLVELGKALADVTYRESGWSGGKAVKGNIKIMYEYNSLYGMYGYHVYACYGW